MRAILFAAAAMWVGCASTGQPEVTVQRQPVATHTRVVTPAPQPQPTYVQPAPQPTVVIPQQPHTTVTVIGDANAQARAREADRLRQAEAERHAAEMRDAQARASDAQARASDAESRATDAEQQRLAAEDRAQKEAAARADAEKHAGDLERELAVLGQVRETERGLVVTLSGDVLFEFDKAVLLPRASIKLNQLAETLKKADLKLAIEGHTDSVGADAYNQDLSTRRSGAVRDYLISQGVPADRMQATGYGERVPIADNATPEGRAMNRRVEIVIERR